MATQETGNVGPQLELSLAGYSVNRASIGYGPDGAEFACTIGPMTDETIAALDGAAENHGTVCLLFPQPLLLDLVAIERKGPHSIRIVGHIVGSTCDRGDAENIA
jgi:hypothetical protein